MRNAAEQTRKFRTKVMAGYGGAVVIAALIGLVSLHVVREISGTVEHLASVHRRDLIQASELRALADRLSEAGRAYLVTRSEEEQTAIRASHDAFQEAVARLGERDNGEEYPMLDAVAEAEQALLDGVQEQAAAADRGAPPREALAAFHAEVTPRLTDLGRRIAEYVRLNERQLELERAAAQGSADRAQTLVVSVASGTFLAMLGLGLLLAMSLDRMYRRTLEAEGAELARGRQHAAVAALAQDALSAADVGELIDRVCGTVARVLDLDHVTVLEMQPDGRHVAARARADASGAHRPVLPLEPDGLLGHTLRRRAPVIVDDARRETRFAIPALLSDRSVVSGISAVVDGPVRAHGLLTAFSTQRRTFSHDDVVFLQAAAHVLGSSLHGRSVEQALRQAVDARDEFLAIASHELRTPLTVLQLIVQGLRRSGAALEGPRGEEKLRRLHSQVNRLGGLVVNLLDGARAASGLDLHFEPVSLGEVVAEVVERVRTDTGRAGYQVELQRSDNAVGYFDRARVAQVVSNLLSNALKFGEGKPVTVSTGVRGDTAWLEVRDRGIGIDAEFRDRLFTRFEQGVSARSYGGLGLGLFLSRRIVEAHGGTIHVESEPGQGATLRVELPLATDALDSRSMRCAALGIASVH